MKMADGAPASARRRRRGRRRRRLRRRRRCRRRRGRTAGAGGGGTRAGGGRAGRRRRGEAAAGCPRLRRRCLSLWSGRPAPVVLWRSTGGLGKKETHALEALSRRN